MRQVEKDFPDVFEDGNRVWNMDKTKVEGTLGKKVKRFVSSSTHHGEIVTSRENRDGKHVTSVICVSASGKSKPPLFIVARKML